MKKKLFVSVIIFAFTNIINAQEGTTTTTTTNATPVNSEPTDNREKFQFGLKVGMSISNVFKSTGNRNIGNCFQNLNGFANGNDCDFIHQENL